MIINFEKATEYTQNLFNIKDEKLLELEKKSIENKVPIITREVLNFMIFLAKNNKSKDILEIGTAVGYSSIFLANVAKENGGKLTTIEIDEERFLEANKNFSDFSIENIISINDDALNVLPNLKDKYDFIFIDASKSKYLDFFNYSYKLLKEGGYIFIDNILFRGYVTEENIPKRYKTMVNNLREFIEYLNKEYNFVLIPFGDGVGIVKK